MVRIAAAVVLLAAVIAATLAPSVTFPSPQAAGYRLITADLHVHGFLGDGALPPSAIRREAARRGLDAVVVTNHNQMYAGVIDRLLFAPPAAPLMIVGIEVTTPRFHLVALGVKTPIEWRLPLAGVIRAVHAQGGIAIGAHPTGNVWQQEDAATLAMLDGLELAHPNGLADASARRRMDSAYSRAKVANPALAAIGASDFHFGAPIGFCRTRLFVRDLTTEAVFEAIRAGRTIAVDPEGRAYGDPQWLEAAAAHPLPDLSAADTPLQHIAMAAAWIALVLLTTVQHGPRFNTVQHDSTRSRT
jgi:hypothetical protein